MKLYAHAEQKICNLRIGPNPDSGVGYIWGVVATFTHLGDEAELTLLTHGADAIGDERFNGAALLAIEIWLARHGAKFCQFERRRPGRLPDFKRFPVRTLAELEAAGLL